MMLGDGISQPLHMHFALQICDTQSLQGRPRVCGDDRTMLSKKSVTSLIESVTLCAAQRPLAQIHVNLFSDRISHGLNEYCQNLAARRSTDRLCIEIVDIAPNAGIGESIFSCYQWMQNQGQEIVAQFQDDYIFYGHAIDDSVDMLLQMQRQASTDAIVTPYNFAAYWKELYENASTPRCIVTGRRDYWIQIYDIACTFMTTHAQFNQHWDLYNLFVELCKMLQFRDVHTGLESQSLNHMMTRRGVLALCPMRSASHHMQSQRELDPHQNWQDLWNTIDIDGSPHEL